MPTIQVPSKVLVSGANGYVAIWVVRTLLEKGYAVRGTVRSADKGKHLQDLFKAYGDRHEIVVVEDITKAGAFDEAVKGVDAIAHTASPFHFNIDDPDDLIKPAVHGTVGMLQSALQYGSSVKRIVVTSSTAAILHDSPNPEVYSEADWNDQSIETVKAQGRDAKPWMKYRASKTLAEKAAWEFVEKNKSEITWDLAVVAPPFVFGPPIHDLSSSPSSLNTSLDDWYKLVLTPSPSGTLFDSGSSWIDVRDLAQAHVLMLEREEASGERVIVSAGPYLWQDWLNAANALPSDILSTLASPNEIPKGDPAHGSTLETVYRMRYDARKADRVLGLQYRSLQESTRDMVEDFARRGW